MADKEIIFADNNSSEIIELVKKYKLKERTSRSDGSPEIIAGGILAQTCRDIVEKRITLENASLKIKEFFSIDINESNKLIDELNKRVISLAETISFETKEGPSMPKKSLRYDNKNKNLHDGSSSQDSYRELIK